MLAQLAAIFLAFPLFTATLPEVEPAPARPMEKLETAIPHAIKLLEAKKHAEFLKAFVEPEELKKILAKMKIEEFARAFAAGHAEKLLGVLKEIKGTKPKLEDDGKKAVFAVKKQVIGKPTITFRKHGASWHIQN